MISFSTILCVIDPESESHHAFSRAKWLAESCGASLGLLTCCYNEYLSGDRFFDAPSLEKARQELITGHKKRLEELAGPLRAAGLHVATHAVWDHPPYEGIVRHAVSLKADLVMKETRHHLPVARALFGNADWSLIRACPVPLWLVKPHRSGRFASVIAAIDPLNEHDKPAALDDEILVLGKSVAQIAHSSLHAFHAYDPGIALATAAANAYVPVSLPCAEIEEQEREHHRRRFDEIVEYHGIEAANAHLVAGLTHEELPKLVKELNGAVVVMGAVARNPLKRLFIGATAERTLDNLPCDLLIVKPQWFTTPVKMEVV